MAIEVELPALGESVVEGTVSRWLVKEGEAIERDQPVVEVTTDKVDAEIPAPSGGVVVAFLVSEGDTVPVGTPLVRIDPDAAATATPKTASAPKSATAPTAAPGPAASETSSTPLARRVAEQSGVDVASVAGSGTAGRVTKGDVERHLSAVPTQPKSDAPRVVTQTVKTQVVRSDEPRPSYLNYQLEEGDKVIPMSPLRRLVAEHMVVSKRVSPHVGTVAEIDMGGIARVRDSHKRGFKEQHGYSLSFLPFIIHAMVRALREFPRLNASVLDDAIVEKKSIHMGVAVETAKGLVVPVVRNADRLSLTGIAAAVEDLASRARSKKLSPDELKGGTFTLSNPGRNGNLYGFAIINQPQVGIVRMGEIVKRPVVRTANGEDAIVIRPIMHLSLSYDHRAVDGAPANGFLFRIRELLEEAEFDL